MNNQKNKLMVIEISRFMLNHLGGFSKEIFVELMNALPPGTLIRGIGEEPSRDINTILLSHDSFPEITSGLIYPTINAVIHKNTDEFGKEIFKIDIEWPKEYKTAHVCQYYTYQGFNSIEEICGICGNKK